MKMKNKMKIKFVKAIKLINPTIIKLILDLKDYRNIYKSYFEDIKNFEGKFISKF